MLRDEDCEFWLANLSVLRFKDPAHVLWVPFHLLHSRLFLTFLSPACLSLWGTHGICVFSAVHFSDELDVDPRCGRPPLSSLFPSPTEPGPRGGYSVSHWSGAGLGTWVRIPEGAQSLAEPNPHHPGSSAVPGAWRLGIPFLLLLLSQQADESASGGDLSVPRGWNSLLFH